MNYKNKNLEELNKKINNLDIKKNNNNKMKKENGASFGFKSFTES